MSEAWKLPTEFLRMAYSGMPIAAKFSKGPAEDGGSLEGNGNSEHNINQYSSRNA